MRYLPHTDAARREMLAAIGSPSVDALFRDVPASARLDGPIAGLPTTKGELEVERHMAALAARSRPAGTMASFIGAGAYRHHVPSCVDHLVQRGEFLTSYTPYQPEVSQGTLQYLFEFQTQVAMVTGMDVANASMYDGATATVEAVMMANRVTKRGKAVLSGGLHPHYRAVVETHARFGDFRAVCAPPLPAGGEDLASLVDGETSCVVVQNPSAFGQVVDLSPLARACQAKGALLVVVVTEIVSLGLLSPPGAMGADIVAAEGQSIGNALNFGGPHVGLFATREKYVRQMPGRLTGETVDADGRRGWVLTLSTREQHIRREKATSNICTNSGLCALAFTIHLSLLGEDGYRRLAELNHANAVTLAGKLDGVRGARLVTEAFFNEFTLKLPVPAAGVVDELAAQGILAGVPGGRLWPERPELADLLVVAATETNTEAEMDLFASKLEEML
jgi:glycine dehydrogenase subunit 1